MTLPAPQSSPLDGSLSRTDEPLRGPAGDLDNVLVRVDLVADGTTG